ncbi:MAG: nucleoside triphosphate pyrophosphohydrolase [Desulfobacteraceae bacterium]|nr:nucleoside triphosphate pyrophosphohydrolase [Desulfobacteraceae bacterium]
MGPILDVITALRAENGCPWDKKQTPKSIGVYLVEEVYELLEAVDSGDLEAIKEELGDVLFQLMFYVRLFSEKNGICFDEIINKIKQKMIRRHPHVFGDAKAGTVGQVKKRWREIKQEEKEEKNESKSLMDSVPSGMPALPRAYLISERAAGAGFDWNDLKEVMDQTEEEWQEFIVAIDNLEDGLPEKKENAAMEFGDILFTLINVGRISGIHPETALQSSANKFIRRFKCMEKLAQKKNRVLKDIPRDEMEKLWETAKKSDKGL